MATFSPSPTPRRSSRLKRGPSLPRSRNATGDMVASHLMSQLHSERSQFSDMDIDEGSVIYSERGEGGQRMSSKTTLAKSDELCASFYANFPLEVKQILRSTDLDRDICAGAIDTLTGFATIASPHTCFVWQYAQVIRRTPTCYIFSCPRDLNERSAPFRALIPHSTSREPGLILLSCHGQVRFWDSILMGLAGGDHWASSQMELMPGEEVNNLVRSDAQTYIASTTKGRLLRLTLVSAGGKYQLASHSFSRPVRSRSFSNILPSIFNPSSSHATSLSSNVQYIDSIALGLQTPTGDRDVWTFAQGWLHKWVMKSEGWEDLILEQNMALLLEPAVKESLASLVSRETIAELNLDLELLDVAVDIDEKLVILISHSGIEDGSSTMHINDGIGVRRIYALARVTPFNDTFKIESIRRIPYQSTFTSAVDLHARMQLLFGGFLVSVQFGDAVAFCARDSEYVDRLELKSATERTFGVGVNSSDNSLLVLTATMILKVELDMDAITAFTSQTGRTSLIKNIMLQAILYGSIPENPLHFSFPPELGEESLMNGAEQLSQAVLQSNPLVVHSNYDLTSQIIGRKERLSWLIGFINDNAALGKMSQQSRQKLATDAEKLYACHQLWLQYNELLATNPDFSVLNDSVYAFMEEVGEGSHEDIMRAFFRLRVSDVGRMIRKVMDVATLATTQTGRNISEFIPEAISVVMTVLRSAFDYRDYNLAVYGIDLPMINSWTSRPAIIDVVLTLFDATTKAADTPDATFERGSHVGLTSQFPDLAALLFRCIQERLDWLTSPAAANDPASVRDRDELEQKFTMLRPEVLETLRRNNHEEAAFSLAEQYRDFSSLAVLCHRGMVFPADENPNAARIQSYVDRFKTDFTTELYRWYIQHGELRVMFNNEDKQHVYMEKFFNEHPHDAISWIYDLGQGRYGRAASALFSEAQLATSLETKHFMLSIGKLSHLAQLQETDASADEATLDAFHDELDFISVHEALVSQFRSALEGVRGRQPLESQIDIIIKAGASSLADRKAIILIFRDLLRQLLQGKTLSIEDVVDLLTLKDNYTTVDDFATALHLFARAENLPPARRMSTFRTIWRRIYIHDDWDTIRKTANVSDVELSERFKSTSLYTTLCSTLRRENQFKGFDISPDEALMVPSADEIRSRWPGMSHDQVQSVIQDYNSECDRLGELDLEDVYSRIRELAARDVAWESDLP